MPMLVQEGLNRFLARFLGQCLRTFAVIALAVSVFASGCHFDVIGTLRFASGDHNQCRQHSIHEDTARGISVLKQSDLPREPRITVNTVWLLWNNGISATSYALIPEDDWRHPRNEYRHLSSNRAAYYPPLFARSDTEDEA